MKKTSVLVVLIAALAIAVLNISAGPGTSVSEKKAISITGTWQLSSYKYGSTLSGFSDVSPGIQHIKLITDTYFTWVAYNTNTKKVTSSSGGTYTLVGNTYTESLDFGLGMDYYMGRKPVYTLIVEGDMLFLSGFLAENYKIEEIWLRVK